MVINMKWYQTTRNAVFVEQPVTETVPESSHKVVLTGEKKQKIKGFGGCFNELSAIALEKTSKENREKIYQSLFGKEGLQLGFNRIPIGASDYAAEWYSHDEYDDDYTMKHFSIERDYKYLIPYIKEAQKHYKGDMKFFASPWSPPTWMKFPKACNYGRLRMEPEILKAYALYFDKFIEAYEKEGIPIAQLHVQNEPFADQKFPSCLWRAEDFRIFIRDYLGPHFEERKINTDIFLGTLNGPEDMDFSSMGIKLDNYNKYVDTILFDEEARKYIKGVGYQWAGRNAIGRTHECFPELELIQTENECGDGQNSWEYAQYMFNLMCHYLKNGVRAYTYWNMVLETGGESTWGWRQNSMISIEPSTGEVTYNPEYYVMKHYAHFIQPGAVRLETEGAWNSAAVAFENPNGSVVIEIQNAMDREEAVTLEHAEESITVKLAPNSFNTFVL